MTTLCQALGSEQGQWAGQEIDHYHTVQWSMSPSLPGAEYGAQGGFQEKDT